MSIAARRRASCASIAPEMPVRAGSRLRAAFRRRTPWKPFCVTPWLRTHAIQQEFILAPEAAKFMAPATTAVHGRRWLKAFRLWSALRLLWWAKELQFRHGGTETRRRQKPEKRVRAGRPQLQSGQQNALHGQRRDSSCRLPSAYRPTLLPSVAARLRSALMARQRPWLTRLNRSGNVIPACATGFWMSKAQSASTSIYLWATKRFVLRTDCLRESPAARRS